MVGYYEKSVILKQKIMKRIILLVGVLFFVFGSLHAIESSPVAQNSGKQEVAVAKISKIGEMVKLSVIEKMAVKRQFIKNRKAVKKMIKRLSPDKKFASLMSSMLLVGILFMVAGLVLYLIVTNATWLGIAVMVLGLLLMLYAVLKQFF